MVCKEVGRMVGGRSGVVMRGSRSRGMIEMVSEGVKKVLRDG